MYILLSPSSPNIPSVLHLQDVTANTTATTAAIKGTSAYPAPLAVTWIGLQIPLGFMVEVTFVPAVEVLFGKRPIKFIELAYWTKGIKRLCTSGQVWHVSGAS
jgi:hypothetical protein